MGCFPISILRSLFGSGYLLFWGNTPDGGPGQEVGLRNYAQMTSDDYLATMTKEEEGSRCMYGTEESRREIVYFMNRLD